MQALMVTTANFLIRLASGPIILILVPLYLTSQQQGYWYTMISLAAFVAFADMGLSTILIHSSGHEYGSKTTQKIQENLHKGDMQDLRTAALKIYSFRRAQQLAIFSGIFIFFIGILLMRENPTAVKWAAPWALFCALSSASLMLTIVLSFYEGRDAVVRIQGVRTIIAATNLMVVGFSLVGGLDLWALPLGTGISVLIGFLALKKYTNSMYLKHPQFPREKLAAEVQSWSNELSPLIFKYSASWIGGYAMFQLFTPIVFYFCGPDDAGRVGLTISIFSAIFSLASIWSTFQLPNFSISIARSDWCELKRRLRLSLWGSVLTYVAGLSLLLILYKALLLYFPRASSRILNVENILALSLIWLFQLIVHTLAIYLRAFKEEPLAVPTLIAAFHTLLITITVLILNGLPNMFWGLVSVYAWFLPVILIIYNKKAKFVNQKSEICTVRVRPRFVSDE